MCLTLASELGSVETVVDAALGLGEQGGFDEDTLGQISLVVREAAVNAIVHGNRHDLEKRLSARLELNDEALSIHIADEGDGVAVDQIPDPLQEENLLRTSGRGVFLMRAFMDEVHFDSLEPGTGITLIKYRPKGEVEA